MLVVVVFAVLGAKYLIRPTVELLFTDFAISGFGIRRWVGCVGGIGWSFGSVGHGAKVGKARSRWCTDIALLKRVMRAWSGAQVIFVPNG